MADKLRIALVQTPLIWEDPRGNFDKLEGFLGSVQETDIIVHYSIHNTLCVIVIVQSTI